MPEDHDGTQIPTNTHEDTQGNTPTHAHRWMGPFLASLSFKANVTVAAEEAGITRVYAYHVKAEDPDFAAAWDEAIQQGVERLEAEAWRRAYEGVERPVFQGGEQVGKVREYSDTLMQTLLKGHAPQKYRERSSVEMTGKDGGPIDLRNISDDELKAEAAKLIGAQAARGDSNGTPTPPVAQ